MKIKVQKLLPLLLIFTIFLSAAGGFLWYSLNIDRSGWVEREGIRFYRDFHGKPVSGWLDLEEGRYFFSDGGIPVSGWQEIDGVTYYFDEKGTMTTGWKVIGDKTCYFGGNGAMVTGWLWLEDGRYYLRDGTLLTGWQELDGQTCYFDENGIAAMGMTRIDGKTYFFSDVYLAIGLTEIDGKFYWFSEDGMHVGWLECEDGIRCFDSEGKMLSGWQEDAEGIRYFGDTGLLTVGWYQDGEYRRYFNEDGLMATCPTEIDGEVHYFTPKGLEVVLVNGLNPVPEWYQADLVSFSDNHQVASLCYDSLVQMLDDLVAEGIEYDFNSGYRTLYTQTAILEYRTREHMAEFDLDFSDARDKALETVAVPGTSEHHLGLAVDLLGSEAIAWLTEHCWEYGFILRYTEEKEAITGIIDEPWHFRYVGKEISMDMKDSGLCLEEYLGAESVTPEKVRDLFGDKLYEETIYGKEEQTSSEAA